MIGINDMPGKPGDPLDRQKIGSRMNRFIRLPLFPAATAGKSGDSSDSILAKQFSYFAFELCMLDFVEKEPLGIQLLGALP